MMMMDPKIMLLYPSWE